MANISLIVAATFIFCKDKQHLQLVYNVVMVIGIDIGGTKIGIGMAKNGRQIERHLDFATPPDYHQALHLMVSSIQRLSGGDDVTAVGIASPGPLNPTAGIILAPHNVNWHYVEITKDLERLLHCPVRLENDATLGGIAEARFGAGKPYTSVLYITISTGIGTSLIINQQPLPTQYNMEGGHQLLQVGDQNQLQSFESLVSGHAIKQHYGKIAADISDPQIWDEIAQHMSWGIFNLITMCNPEVVVLAGGVSVHHKRFLAPLRTHLAALPALYPLPKIVPARYIETAPLLGALELARESVI